MSAHTPDEQIELVVDIKSGRPACVLLQAAFRCPRGRTIVGSVFPARTWLTYPTDDMRRVSGTLAQWRQHATRLAETGERS